MIQVESTSTADSYPRSIPGTNTLGNAVFKDWGKGDGFWEMIKDTECVSGLGLEQGGGEDCVVLKKGRLRGSMFGQEPNTERGTNQGAGVWNEAERVAGIQRRLRGVGERRIGKSGVEERWASPDAAEGSIGKSNTT